MPRRGRKTKHSTSDSTDVTINGLTESEFVRGDNTSELYNGINSCNENSQPSCNGYVDISTCECETESDSINVNSDHSQSCRSEIIVSDDDQNSDLPNVVDAVVNIPDCESNDDCNSMSNSSDISCSGSEIQPTSSCNNTVVEVVECPSLIRSSQSVNSMCKFVELKNEERSDVGSEELVQRLEMFTEKCHNQKFEIERLTRENRLLRENVSLANDRSVSSSDMVLAEETADIYEVQMAALEKTITQLQKEVEAQRDRLADQDYAANGALTQLRRELGGKHDRVTKQLELVTKEKESAVVKYAQSEANVLMLKKNIDEKDRKSKELVREKDMLLNKVRLLTADKVRMSQALDMKASEISSLQRDSEKLREEISSKDIKTKWAQNRMMTEVDAHKETIAKLERTEHKLRETREEAEQVRRDCQEMIRTYQNSEEIKSNSLDIQLREKEVELKRERQEKSTKEEVQLVMKQELDGLRSKLKMCVDENNGLNMKLQALERERLDYEGNLGRMKEQTNSGLQEIVDLQARLSEMDNLMVQINREREKVSAAQTEIERLRQLNAELQIDMDACRRKEGELLEFTERLTGKNVCLQSEFSSLEARCQALERELPIIREQCDDLDQQKNNLATELIDEQEQNKKETQLLARKLAEKTKAIEALNVKLEEQANDNKVLKRKNSSSVRELTREIQMLRRRLDVHEANARGNLDSQSLGSRASSTTSLDALGQREQPINGQTQQNSKPTNQPRDAHETNTEDQPPVQPTQGMLVDRIVKLQRMHARKNEKIEFLEEHVSQLVQELKKKSRLVQNYVMREDAGTLSTLSMDQHKMDVSRRGGIMASLYSTQQVDNGLTLELSLEISRKLQAVLEDTLLKNITLKENIKTLGDEIDRLSIERRQL